MHLGIDVDGLGRKPGPPAPANFEELPWRLVSSASRNIAQDGEIEGTAIDNSPALRAPAPET
jgi:hypothetical protein